MAAVKVAVPTPDNIYPPHTRIKLSTLPIRVTPRIV